MKDLIAGYRRFRASRWGGEKERFEVLSREGQHPRAMVITCSDSRVDPQMIFGAVPGELFVVQNVASLVPAYAPDAALHGTSAALEFGVRVLEVDHLVVMGHALCGGVRALLEGAPPEARDFIAGWMSIAEPARRRAEAHPPEDRQHVCEHETVRVSLDNLMTFPWVRERVADGRLELHGCWFDIRNGGLMLLGADGKFATVEG